jgi:hypothetical protein
MAVTAIEVKNLIPDAASLGDQFVEAIITDATTYVNSMLATCDNLSATDLDGIIKWFAAHMLASGPVRQVKREKLGEAEVEYDIQHGVDLTSTSYGRMVLVLDKCGKMKNAGKQAVVIKAVTSFK